MRIRRRLATILMGVALATSTTLTVPQQAQAVGTVCRTLNLSGELLSFAVRTSMTTPVCYNGSRIWRNGGLTPRITTVGYYLNGISWAGSYNDRNGGWMGVGMNFSVTVWTGVVTLSCNTRWLINASGNVYRYDRGCS